jgi:hypothetical protein
VAIQTWMLDQVFPGVLGSISHQLSFVDAQGGRPNGFAGRRADRIVPALLSYSAVASTTTNGNPCVVVSTCATSRSPTWRLAKPSPSKAPSRRTLQRPGELTSIVIMAFRPPTGG